MVMNPRNVETNSASLDVIIEDQAIANMDHTQLLGVIIDKDINFSKHMGEVCTKAGRKVGVLTRLRNMIPCSAKLNIYNSSILPLLTYCHAAWHFCKASDTRKIERVQERALRAIYRTKNEDYETLLKRARLPTLKNRRLQDIEIYMYKVKNQLAPRSVEDIFTEEQSCYSLRNSDFATPRFNTTSYGKHSLRYLGPVIWSKLNSNDRKSPTLKSFKTKLRE